MPNDPTTDEEIVDRWWHKVRAYWHIGSFIVMMIFIAATNWSKVLAYDGRITTLESKQEKQDKKLTRMDYNVQLIGRAVGVKPLEKGDDE